MGRSAFWGQSFVSELSRLSPETAKKRGSIDGAELDEGVDLKADERVDSKTTGDDKPATDDDDRTPRSMTI